jgi:hypothetical protein
MPPSPKGVFAGFTINEELFKQRKQFKCEIYF